MQALVLLTFTSFLKRGQTMQYHTTPQDCTCCEAIPDAEFAVFSSGILMLSHQLVLIACACM